MLVCMHVLYKKSFSIWQTELNAVGRRNLVMFNKAWVKVRLSLGNDTVIAETISGCKLVWSLITVSLLVSEKNGTKRSGQILFTTPPPTWFEQFSLTIKKCELKGVDWMASSVDPDQTAPLGSRSTLPTLVILSKYLAFHGMCCWILCWNTDEKYSIYHLVWHLICQAKKDTLLYTWAEKFISNCAHLQTDLSLCSSQCSLPADWHMDRQTDIHWLTDWLTGWLVRLIWV